MKCKIGRIIRRGVAPWGDYALISLATMALVFLFMLIPLSFARFNTAQNLREQYELTDAFFTIFHNGRRAYAAVDERIVIVDVGGMQDRDSVATLLGRIERMEPGAIGVDLIFREAEEPAADARLEARIVDNPRVVTAVWLTGRDGAGSFTSCLDSFFGSDPARRGFANLETEGTLGVCRSFSPWLTLDGEKVPGFTTALLRTVSPERYAQLEKRSPRKRNLINFNAGPPLIVDARQVDAAADLLRGRVVLVGEVSSTSDVHPTPIDQRMSGVEIHAYTLATMLHGRYIGQMSEAGAWVMALLSVFLLLPLLRLVKRNEWLRISIPVIQLLLILAAIFIGYWLFVRYGYYVRFIYTLLGIGFAETVGNYYFKIRETIKKR